MSINGVHDMIHHIQSGSHVGKSVMIMMKTRITIIALTRSL